jgi:SAM-dependent methyltransferase
MATNTPELEKVFGKSLNGDFQNILAELFKPSLSSANDKTIVLKNGNRIPVVRSVPRFVASDQYSGSFSFQWSTYTTTQVDSVQDTTLTEQDLINKTGLTPEQVAGKLILDAGVGVGRHAEVLARWGARVVGIDLSAAVEAARENLATYDQAVVIQADISSLPFRHNSFDMIVAVGVLHHTPDTRLYTSKLVPFLKPGGELAIWVYPPGFDRRGEWVPMVSHLPLYGFNEWCHWIVNVARQNRGNPWLEAFMHQFPFATHHPTAERSALALFDGYTPNYHWTHDEDEVTGWMQDFGLTDIQINHAPTAVRARRPHKPGMLTRLITALRGT